MKKLLHLFRTQEIPPRSLAPWERVTTDNLHLSTAQDVYTTVVLHLVQQDERAFKHRCMYLIEERGTRCAAGALLTEENFQNFPRMKTLSEDWFGFLDTFTFISENNADIIIDLQSVHDNPANWRYRNEEFILKNEGLLFVEEKYGVISPFGG